MTIGPQKEKETLRNRCCLRRILMLHKGSSVTEGDFFFGGGGGGRGITYYIAPIGCKQLINTYYRTPFCDCDNKIHCHVHMNSTVWMKHSYNNYHNTFFSMYLCWTGLESSTVLVLKYIFISTWCTWALGVWKCQSTCTCTCTWPKKYLVLSKYFSSTIY